ncbi:MAG: hypothetical protein JSU87_02655 [Gemmatimonadota bacterium]|nr:MAG: hypothetical protein JSU87_02655 [Gemmatimonadota bacterium]
MKAHERITVLACFVLVAALACGDGDSTAPDNAPAGHTVIQDGVAHRPGLNDPTQECVACHGADLRGGENGEPSCFSCHGRKWP